MTAHIPDTVSVELHRGEEACLAWRAKRNAALQSGASLPGWEAHVYTFTQRNPALPHMGSTLSDRTIIVGHDRASVERAAAGYPANCRQLYEHGVDLMYRGEIAA